MDFTHETEQSLEWRKYLDIALRYKWLIILPAIAGLIISTGVAFYLPKVYRAYTLILVENKQLLQPLVKDIAVSTSVKARLNAIQEEVLSWPRLMQLVERLELESGSLSPAKSEALVSSLKSKIRVRMNKNNLIQISYEDEDPEKAQSVVKTICDILIAENVTAQSQEADEAIVFIQKQLDDYREKLEDSEDELRKFKEAYTYSLPVAARVNKQIVDLEMKLNLLLIDNTEQHPSVIALKKKIVQLRGEREKELIKMETQGVDVKSKRFEDISYSLPRQEQELARLRRDTKVNAVLYEQLLQRLESAKISKRLDSAEEGTRFKIIEPVRRPITPFKPQKERIILIGFAAGLALGCGISLLLELSNTSIRNIEEAKKIFAFPLLGTISKIAIDPVLIKEWQKTKNVRSES